MDDRIIPSAYNEIPVDDYLRLDLGLVWQLKDKWEIGILDEICWILIIPKICTTIWMLSQERSSGPSCSALRRTFDFDEVSKIQIQ